MARLKAQAELEYFPTQDRIRPIIRSYLKYPERGTTCLDPCCGPGDALIEICPDQHLYGVEIHPGRAYEAKNTGKFVKVLISPLESCHISNRGFGLVFCNPPYDWAPDADGEGSYRYEEAFLGRSTQYLSHKGVLVLIVPTALFQYRGKYVLKHLLENYQDIKIFRYPDPEFNQFKQLVIFGVRKAVQRVQAEQEWYDKTSQTIVNGELPVLEMQTEPQYSVPEMSTGNVKIFFSNAYSREIAEAESKLESILQKQASQSVLKRQMVSPYLPTKEHAALLAIGGYCDGKMPDHYLLGSYTNEPEQRIEVDLETGEESLTTRKKSSTVFYILAKNPDGEGKRIREIR